MSFAHEPKVIQGFMSGGSAVAPNAEQVLAIMCVAQPGRVRSVIAATNGAGNQTCIIDLRKNGVSVWTDPAHRPSLAAGKAGLFTSYPPDRRALQTGDILTLVVAQSGNNANVAATAVIEYPELF